ncbi:hypothetical protein M231_07322 [Tremella mesenterica]|uniref:Uncharacterized protein n=1 Tax=Tremella mesenterica TaxID=5217 RepID=A0A4Q1B9F7_TREME|nr:hypothetical protein M231_07322 [Tremella mesenterica]
MPANHMVFIPVSISHLRTMLQLMINLLNLHPSLIITLLSLEVYNKRLDQEFALHPKQTLDAVRDRYRVVMVPDGLDDAGNTLLENSVFLEKGRERVEGLIRGDEEGKWGKRPCAFIIDICRAGARGMIIEITQQMGLPKIPCLRICPTMAMGIYR